MPRVASFTEQALFHRRVLDFVCPTEYDKLKIQSVGDSVIQSLQASQRNPYANLKKTSYFHIGTKPLKAALRVAYTGFVTLTFSRIGTLVNGARTIFSFGQYKLQVYRHDESAGTESWNKTKDYAYAFFVDLAYAFVGSFMTKGIVELTAHSLHTLHITSQFRTFAVPLSQRFLGMLVAPLSVAVLSFCLGGFNPAYVLSRILAGSDTRVGMFLSLSLRNQLGLVGPDGGLLPFSQADRIERNADTKQFVGDNYKALYMLVQNAEYELIETVCEANRHLAENDKISFAYPFNGQELAAKLRTLPSSATFLHPIANKLDLLGKKIQILRDLVYTSCDLAVADSLVGLFMQKYADQNYKEPKIERFPSFIPRQDYQEYYNLIQQGSSNEVLPNLAATVNYTIHWESLSLTWINPTLSPPSRSASLYEQFGYDVRVNKWYTGNGQSDQCKTPEAILGLKAGFSYSDYAQARYAYRMAISPARHHNTPESKELSKYLEKVFFAIEHNPNNHL